MKNSFKSSTSPKDSLALKPFGTLAHPVYISTGLAEELEIIMPDVSLHPEKESAHWAFGFLLYFFFPSLFLSLLSANTLEPSECLAFRRNVM